MYGLALTAMASIMTKRKILARLTIASATPARLTGLRNSMRERCQGSGGAGGIFSVSMISACGFGFVLGFGWWVGGCNGLFFGRVTCRFRNHPSVESMLIAVVVQRHFSVPPRPVHGIHVGVEEHLVEVPHDDGQGRQHRFIE